MRRKLHIALHWTIVLSVLIMVKGGEAAPVVRWIYVIAVAIWVGMAITLGLNGRPGPKLSPTMRQAYPWMHRALYLTLAGSAGANAAALLGWVPTATAWNSILIVMAVGSFHAIFHLYRHTALYDGALRLITPRFMHKHL